MTRFDVVRGVGAILRKAGHSDPGLVALLLRENNDLFSSKGLTNHSLSSPLKWVEMSVSFPELVPSFLAASKGNQKGLKPHPKDGSGS